MPGQLSNQFDMIYFEKIKENLIHKQVGYFLMDILLYSET